MIKSVKTDVLRVGLGNFLSGAVMVLIFAVLGYFSPQVVYGAVLGSAFVTLSFLWLAVSVSKNVERDPKNAQARVSATYTLRLLCAAGMVILAIKSPLFNWAAAVIPLFYQRFVIMIVGHIRSRKNKTSEVTEG